MARIPARIPGRELEEFEDKLYLSNAADKTGELKVYAGTSGEKALEIFSGSTSILHILATTTTARILGGSSTPVQIGDATSTSRGLTANDDLFVSGKLEVHNAAYFNNIVLIYSNLYLPDAYGVVFGTSSDTLLAWKTTQASAHTLVFGLGDTSKSIIFCDLSDLSKDFDHAAQSNPTIFVHSATNPDTANDEWISISHDVTDGVIDVGSGTLNLGGTTVNFVNATRTASTVTHDAYVTLEIGGTEYKFMLGS